MAELSLTVQTGVVIQYVTVYWPVLLRSMFTYFTVCPGLLPHRASLDCTGALFWYVQCNQQQLSFACHASLGVDYAL